MSWRRGGPDGLLWASILSIYICSHDLLRWGAGPILRREEPILKGESPLLFEVAQLGTVGQGLPGPAAV